MTRYGLRYPGGEAASLLADHCEPYRLAYFGFGLEDVAGAAQRTELISSTFAYFAQPESEIGLRFDQPGVEDLVPSGARRDYSIGLQNLSETITDTFTLRLVGKIDTQSLPGGTTMVEPSVSDSSKGASMLPRSQVPSTRTPSWKSSACPVPVVRIAGTEEPLEPAGGDAKYLTAVSTTSTSVVT